MKKQITSPLTEPHHEEIEYRKHLEEVIRERTAELQKSNELIAESRSYLDKFINAVADPIFVKDRQHRWVLLNDAYCAFMGYERERLIGKSDRDFFPTEEADVFWSKDELVFTLGVENDNEEIFTDAKGETHTILTKKTHYINEKGEEFIVGIIREISAHKKMEAEMIKAQKLESLGVLAGGIAHDFNNILTVILGNISLAKLSVPDNETLCERLTEAEKAVARAKDLTQRLLTFSKGGAPIRRSISAVELIKESVSLAASGTNVLFELQIPDGLWSLDADEGQVSQVIHNIVINAIQAMPQGGNAIVRCENIPLYEGSSLPLKTGNYVKISIQDRGIGIPEEFLGKIFDPYFSTKAKGKGLGLASTYSIIKNHNGHIAVESKPGTGSTFTVYLPASESPLVMQNEPTMIEASDKKKILIMDDETVVRGVAAKMLQHSGYEVELAKNGTEAVESYLLARANGTPFDAVIMDLTVPGGMGGKEAIRKLQEVDPNVRAIVSSGYSNDPVMSSFKDHGFIGMVTKPYRMDELCAQVQKVIHGDGKAS